LPAALQQGLITEATLDQALIRQYASLVRTGYFNGPNAQYRNLTFSDVSTPQAQSLARLVAAEGMVLLKNNGFLPMPKNNMSIAMIGDWANATGNMQSSYTGRAPYLHSPVYAAEQLGYTVNFAQGPGGQGDPTTDSWDDIWPAVNKCKPMTSLQVLRCAKESTDLSFQPTSFCISEVLPTIPRQKEWTVWQ